MISITVFFVCLVTAFGLIGSKLLDPKCKSCGERWVKGDSCLWCGSDQ